MSDRIVQFTQLGRFGRFGNQVFQYLFARAYAEKYDAILEIPDWVGEKIFKDVGHRHPSVKLPRTSIDEVSFGTVNIDLFGYFQKKKFIEILSETKIREWLQFQDRWIEQLKKEGIFSVVAHLRRGDYTTLYPNIFCVISKKPYLNACDKFSILKDNITWLSEENQECSSFLDKDLQFLSDFFLMINADILLRSNSTFSFWAGFFSKGKVYSPVVGGKVGLQDVEFAEGNTVSIVSMNSDFIFSP